MSALKQMNELWKRLEIRAPERMNGYIMGYHRKTIGKPWEMMVIWDFMGLIVNDLGKFHHDLTSRPHQGGHA